MSKSAKVVLGREPINSEWLADVRFGAHSGLKSDITALPKCANSGLSSNGLEHPSAPSALLLCNLQGAVRKRAGIAS